VMAGAGEAHPVARPTLTSCQVSGGAGGAAVVRSLMCGWRENDVASGVVPGGGAGTG